MGQSISLDCPFEYNGKLCFVATCQSVVRMPRCMRSTTISCETCLPVGDMKQRSGEVNDFCFRLPVLNKLCIAALASNVGLFNTT